MKNLHKVMILRLKIKNVLKKLELCGIINLTEREYSSTYKKAAYHIIKTVNCEIKIKIIKFIGFYDRLILNMIGENTNDCGGKTEYDKQNA